MEDWVGGIEGFEVSRDGLVALGFRVLVGLTEVRRVSGEAGADVLDLEGSSTMYMEVSKSRNSAGKNQTMSRYSSCERLTRRLRQASNDIVIAREVYSKVALQS